jgi:hypothetical protein
MNFELVRIGWPNTVAIVALAIMPIVSLAAAPQRSEAAAETINATICPAPQNASMVLATLLPKATLE